MTDDLVTWLRDQLDDDELSARAVLGADAASWDPYGYLPGEKRDYLTRFDPARVLAEVDAKRRILRRGGPVCTCADFGPPMNPETNWTTPLEHHLDCAAYETAQLFALPLADRPGYRDEWRPA